jgi:hypothetical protein
MSEKRDDGTRFVVAPIRVNPEDETKCGEKCQYFFFDWKDNKCCSFENEPGKSFTDGVFTHGIRSSACLAAEIKKVEDVVNRAKIVIEKYGNEPLPHWFEWPFPVQISEAYLALMEVIK